MKLVAHKVYDLDGMLKTSPHESTIQGIQHLESRRSRDHNPTQTKNGDTDEPGLDAKVGIVLADLLKDWRSLDVS